MVRCICCIQVIVRVRNRLSLRVLTVAVFRAVGTATLTTTVAMDLMSRGQSAVCRYYRIGFVTSLIYISNILQFSSNVFEASTILQRGRKTMRSEDALVMFSEGGMTVNSPGIWRFLKSTPSVFFTFSLLWPSS